MVRVKHSSLLTYQKLSSVENISQVSFHNFFHVFLYYICIGLVWIGIHMSRDYYIYIKACIYSHKNSEKCDF